MDICIPFVVIGASTGGPEAISKVISEFPAGFPLPVIVLLHIDEFYVSSLISWLSSAAHLPVEMAQTGEKPKAGVIYIAAKNEQLLFDSLQHFVYIKARKTQVYTPSIDLFFESLVDNCKVPGIAVLLTGMGKDGAWGLKKLLDAKWCTIAQSQAGCAIYGMPKAAVDVGAVQHLLPIDDIGPFILKKIKELDMD